MMMDNSGTVALDALSSFYRPVPINLFSSYFQTLINSNTNNNSNNSSYMNNQQQTWPRIESDYSSNASSFVSIAGSDISPNSQVFLLYEMPAYLLAKKFCTNGPNDHRNCSAIDDKHKIMIHELNGCIVGPGMYQEWVNFIYAARNSREQNLELCRSQTNKHIFYYRAIKHIKQGEQLLAWYSEQVEHDLAQQFLHKDSILKSQSNRDSAQCNKCMLNFEHTNLLKSHLLFDVCGKISLPSSNHLSNTPSHYSSSSSTTSNSSSKTNKKESKKTSSSAFSPILAQTKKPDIELISPKSDATSSDTSLLNASSSLKNGVDWKITMLDGTHTVELNVADEMGKQKKTHVCLFCGKIYNRKYGLKIHLRTHTGYKPLKCKVCSRPFSDPSNLNKHVRLHSQTGENTPYRCPYCGKILVRKRDLDRHIMSRHTTASACKKLLDDEELEHYELDEEDEEEEEEGEGEEGEDVVREDNFEIDVVNNEENTNF